SAARTGASEGEFHLGRRLWPMRVLKGEDVELELPCKEWGGGEPIIVGAGATPVPTPRTACLHHPAALGPTLYVAGNNEVYALDLRRNALEVLFDRPAERTWNEVNPDHLHAPTIHHRSLYASFVHHIAIEGEVWRGIPIKVPIPARTLMAFDTATGRRRWSLAESGEPLLRRLSFVGAPVVVGEDLIAAATTFDGFVKSYLCALDPRTGALRWARWLASGGVECTMFGYPAREPLSSPPAAAGDVVYHQTDLGVVAAVDAATGVVLWEGRYPQIPIVNTSSYFPVLRELGWVNSPPVVHGDKVWCAPLDSDHLVAYDRRTGELRATYRRDEGGADLRYLLGVDRGRVVLAGRSVVLLDADTGRLVKEVKLYGSWPVGRGILRGGMAVVPAHDRVFAIDIAAGEPRQIVPLAEGEAEAGNLLCWDRYVVMAGERGLTVFDNAPRPAAAEGTPGR
ncbi:MAG: PQQ-like beta-propeller repeat protein, partial [Planctomycetes bacterium]|nr:PQQ-like beta-propeller repeat protein [Planctomycetota bacterium]